MCLSLTVPWVGLQCVIVILSGHTYLFLGHVVYITNNIDQLFCVSCGVAVNSFNYFTINIAIG